MSPVGVIERIASETGAPVDDTLYFDASSLRNGPAPTCLDMIRHNARTPLDALTD